ncbi:MAG: alpha-galactosidase [Planctomycetia bacterium]|nr:alpha-galactosidase [Planctomycetia bacterium]
MVPFVLFTLLLGPWSITFDPGDSTLIFKHPDQQIAILGKLHFQGPDQEYTIVPPRDGGPNRLALIDSFKITKGYISFQQNGDTIEFLVHPHARDFDGVLTYEARIQFEPDAFTCRKKIEKGERVAAMGNLGSDSLLNDSLFSAEKDLMLHFDAEKQSLKTEGNGKFSLRLQGTGEQTYGISLIKDYFKNRQIPYYAPINRKRCPSPPTGWMSWNIYFDQAGAEENLAEARLGKKYFQPFGMEFWSIESWQGNSDKLPVSKFSNLNLEVNERQFPKGMKQLADDIRALGFRPGIWVVPYGTGNREFYEAHKDWFLHTPSGKPLQTWSGIYTLDPSNEEARAHTRKVLHTVSHDWGYEFFKIDGMGYSRPYTSAQVEISEIRAKMRIPNGVNPIDEFVKDLRKAIGEDRVFLACGTSITAPGVAVCDASRIGADIVSPNQPVKWENILRQGRETLRRLFTHNIVLYNDPDTLMVNTAIPIEEAQTTTTIVSLPGQVMFSGDKLAELPPDRIRLVQQTLPVCNIHPMNLYPYASMIPIWNLRLHKPFMDWNVVALFNWSEEKSKMECSFEELGLDPNVRYLVYEYWTKSFEGIFQKDFAMEVPAHGVRLLAIHPLSDQIQFLSSDRHIAQGAVDLIDLKMSTGGGSGKIKLIGNFPTTIRFYLPDKGRKYDLKISSKEVQSKIVREANDQVLGITLLAPKTEIVDFRIDEIR